MWYKLCKFCENCARDTPLRGVYISHFYQISVKISALGSYTLMIAPIGGKIWHGGTEDPKVPSSMPNFIPIGACRLCGAKTSKSAFE